MDALCELNDCIQRTNKILYRIQQIRVDIVQKITHLRNDLNNMTEKSTITREEARNEKSIFTDSNSIKRAYENEKMIKVRGSSAENVTPSMEKKLRIGDLCWAKVTGYPYWPAKRISTHNAPQHVINSPHKYGQILVEFYGPKVE